MCSAHESFNDNAKSWFNQFRKLCMVEWTRVKSAKKTFSKARAADVDRKKEVISRWGREVRKKWNRKRTDSLSWRNRFPFAICESCCATLRVDFLIHCRRSDPAVLFCHSHFVIWDLVELTLQVPRRFSDEAWPPQFEAACAIVAVLCNAMRCMRRATYSA